MKTIYKYVIPNDKIHHDSEVDIEMPKGSDIISCQMQTSLMSHGLSSDICLWVMVNPNKKTYTRKFHIFGTGLELTDYEKKHYHFVATVQQPPYVWHVFEIYN